MDEHTESSQKISNSLWFGVLHRRGPKNADGPTNKKTRPDTRLISRVRVGRGGEKRQSVTD